MSKVYQYFLDTVEQFKDENPELVQLAESEEVNFCEEFEKFVDARADEAKRDFLNGFKDTFCPVIAEAMKKSGE